MDFLGYAALGGLERVTIVAGAIIIGYWGYRLYGAGKKAGLVFMSLAVLVLAGALLTSPDHLRSVGEGYQLASLPVQAEPGREPSPFRTTDEPGAPQPAADTPPRAEAQVPLPQPAAPAAQPEAAVAEEQPAAEDVPDAAPSAGAPARLATGQELGGRIVSIRSKSISLEWSEDSEDRQ